VEQMGIADYWGPTGPHVAYLRNRVVNDELRSDGRGEDEAIALDDHSNYQYLLGTVVEVGTLQDDGTPDMTTNIIHGHVESGSTVWETDIADHELPVSYYWGCKPNFLGDKAWPLVGPDVTPSVDLPAGDRFASGAFIAPSYERGCDDGSVNPGVDGGITGAGGGTAGSGPASAGGAGPAANSTNEDSGCGCRLAGPGPTAAWAWASLALVGLLLRRWTDKSRGDRKP